MPRIRSLKYGYFINEELAQISAEARLLGLGLTTIADREGRLEDRPARIKVLLFPYHNIDADALLEELRSANFLERYKVAGKRYIQIINFLKHQKPHSKEAESEIPSPEISRLGRGISRKKPEGFSLSDTQGKPSSVVNGLRDPGNGLGDLGSGVMGDGEPVVVDGDPAGAGASAADETPRTEQQEQDFTIWSLGVGKLMKAKMDEREARQFLGGLRNKHGSEVLATAITKMLAQNPLDPKAYLISILKGLKPARPPSRVDESMAAVNRVLAEKEAERDAVH